MVARPACRSPERAPSLCLGGGAAAPSASAPMSQRTSEVRAGFMAASAGERVNKSGRRHADAIVAIDPPGACSKRRPALLDLLADRHPAQPVHPPALLDRLDREQPGRVAAAVPPPPGRRLD